MKKADKEDLKSIAGIIFVGLCLFVLFAVIAGGFESMGW